MIKKRKRNIWLIKKKQKDLFIKGEYSKKQFKADCLSYLSQSIQIEKNGKLL